MTTDLPPLPPLSADAEENYQPAGQSIVDLLAEEHRQITKLSAELAVEAASASPSRRKQVADVVTAVVSRHLAAEEQYLLPAVRKHLPDGDDLVSRELAEDGAIRQVLQTLQAVPPEDDKFQQLALEVDQHLRRHKHTADRRIHGRLSQAATDEELIRLGNRAAIAEEAATTRPHPAAPTTPPWNRLTDPLLGATDKVRDVLSGRSTYPEQL
ncbi:hemerythrin domain-containing protein [Catellatospora tritici]|uniref:hemerythrin domain-containing protein n=1 Tax=Catellatospora tritici TaxID=2851566 RepID=UPI001C2CEA1D|nr:hemerythrin domain-containing protein [Catellatospora tritici]MBV1852369.1 hemerythrin domain-containing protein [Catellatospora tritici]